MPAVPKFALQGAVVTMDDTFTVHDDATVYVADGRIHTVRAGRGRVPGGFEEAPVIQTNGTVYPGLIDLHNHLSYDVLPFWLVPEKYGNRDKWARGDVYRKLVTGPMTVLGKTAGYPPAVVRYVECKCLVGGTTTSQGIRLASFAGIGRFYRGLVRNVEQTDDHRLLPEAATRIADVDANDPARFLRRLKGSSCLLLHLAEGTDTDAHDHFEALRLNGDWAITNALGGIHCVALSAGDFATMAANHGAMVWSPFSNLLLYGATAKIKAAVASTMRIGIGPDWSPTGSKNVLGELKVARLAALEAEAGLEDRDLVALATRNAAAIVGWSGQVGTIEEQKLADLLVVAGDGGDPYTRLLKATEGDVELVVIGGVPRYGLPEPMQRLVGQNGLEELGVGGRQRLLNLTEEAADPVVAGLTLKAATDKLADAMQRLSELAKAFEQQPVADLMAAVDRGEPAFLLDLDHDEPPGVALRPHLPDRHGNLTGETPPLIEAAEAKPLSQLLEPLRLDPLTVVDDDTFFETLARQTNLPQYVKDGLPALY